MNAGNSLITHNLEKRIIRLLEANYKRTGKNEPISWRAIWIESGVDEDKFGKALNAATHEHPPAIIFADSDHIKLNLKVRASTKAIQARTGITGSHDSAALTRRLFWFLRQIQ